MFGTQNLTAFILAGLLLNITPGPDTMYILGRSIGFGRKAGILSVMGIGTGAIGHTFLAAFGLSSILAASSQVFYAVKLMGAGYLIFLGIKTLLDKSALDWSGPKNQPMDHWKIYRQGMLTNLLNPKVALFYLAFLPQFVDPASSNKILSFLFLGFVFIFNGTIYCFLIAIFSAGATKALRQSERFSLWLKRFTGTLFTLLGIRLLFEKQ